MTPRKKPGPTWYRINPLADNQIPSPLGLSVMSIVSRTKEGNTELFFDLNNSHRTRQVTPICMDSAGDEAFGTSPFRCLETYCLSCGVHSRKRREYSDVTRGQSPSHLLEEIRVERKTDRVAVLTIQSRYRSFPLTIQSDIQFELCHLL